jgi:hypothetical protein
MLDDEYFPLSTSALAESMDSADLILTNFVDIIKRTILERSGWVIMNKDEMILEWWKGRFLSSEEWDVVKERETTEQIEMARQALKLGAIVTSVKLVAPRSSYTLYRGRIIFQPYLRQGSLETRWICFASDVALPPVSREHYVQQLKWWHRASNSASAVRAQVYSMISLAVRPGPFTFSETELPIAIFSISNVPNSIDSALLASIVANDGVVVVPGAGMFSPLLKQRKWVDNVYSSELSISAHFSTYTLADWILRNGASVRYDPTHPNLQVWMVIEKKVHDPIQTVMASQTHLVKTVSSVLRRVLRLTSDTLHNMRRQALIQYGGIPIVSSRVTGYFELDGAQYYVAVAGHLVNMIIASAYYVVDVDRWLDTIFANAKKPYDRDDLEEIRSRGKTWHSFVDYFLAVVTCENMVKLFDLPVSINIIAHVKERLRANGKYMGKMGYQSLDYGGSPILLFLPGW